MDVKIVDFPETLVAAIEHRGPPSREYETAMKLVQWRMRHRLPPDRHRSYGIHYDDPLSTPPESYRVDFCVSINTPIDASDASNAGIINKRIPAGRCAMLRHIGSRESISAVPYLYQTWLPNSGELLRDFPLFFHYVNVGADIKEEEMITDVYLPIS